MCFFLTRQKGRRRCELLRLSTGTSSPFLPSSLTRLLVLLKNKDDMPLRGKGQYHSGLDGEASLIAASWVGNRAMRRLGAQADCLGPTDHPRARFQTLVLKWKPWLAKTTVRFPCCTTVDSEKLGAT